MFLDIGLGIFLALGLSTFFGMDITPGIVTAGVLLALLPDIDVPLTYLTGGPDGRIGRLIGGHRGLLHMPVVYAFATIMFLPTTGVFWALLFFLCTFAHLLHDTCVLGWGIAWGAPWSERKYTFLPHKDGRILWQKLSWMPNEEQRIKEQYGTPHWIRTFYMRPNPYAYLEYSIFILSLIVCLIVFW